jgi:hypothetical protein
LVTDRPAGGPKAHDIEDRSKGDRADDRPFGSINYLPRRAASNASPPSFIRVKTIRAESYFPTRGLSFLCFSSVLDIKFNMTSAPRKVMGTARFDLHGTGIASTSNPNWSGDTETS